MTILSATFWTLDFILGFFVGYYASGGTLEKRPRQTAANYAKTWMVPDLLLLMLPDCMKREHSKAVHGIDVVSQSGETLTGSSASRGDGLSNEATHHGPAIKVRMGRCRGARHPLTAKPHSLHSLLPDIALSEAPLQGYGWVKLRLDTHSPNSCPQRT